VKKTGLKIKLYGAIILGLMILPMFFGVEKAHAVNQTLVYDTTVVASNLVHIRHELGQGDGDVISQIRIPFCFIQPFHKLHLVRRVATGDFHGPFTDVIPVVSGTDISCVNNNSFITLPTPYVTQPAYKYTLFLIFAVHIHEMIPDFPIVTGTREGPLNTTYSTNIRGLYPIRSMNVSVDGSPFTELISHTIQITNILGNVLGQIENTYSAPIGPGLSYYIRTFIHGTSDVSGTNFTHETGLIGHPNLLGGTNVTVFYPFQASVGNNYFISYLFEINHLGQERLVAISPVRNFYVPAITPAPPGWTPPTVTPIPTAPDIVAGLPTVLVPIVGLVDETVGGLNSLFNAFIGNITARFPFSWIVGIRDAINQEAQDAVDVIRYPTLNIQLPAFGNTTSSTVDMLPITALMTSTHIMGQPNQFPAIVTIFRNILLFSSWILFSLFIIKRVRSFTNNLGTVEKN